MKKFKNTFGVSGTQTEIDLFIKEVEKLGWKYGGGKTHKTFLYFSPEEDEIESEFYSVINPGNEKYVSLSTLDGWNKAIELASEEVEEIKYIKYLNNTNCYFRLTENKIYPVLEEFELCFSVANDINKITEYGKRFFSQATRQAFQAQEELKTLKVLINKVHTKYVRCINNTNCSHLILGKIYPLITKNIQVFPDFYIIEDKKRPEVYHKKYFEDSTVIKFEMQDVEFNKSQEEPTRYTVEEFKKMTLGEIFKLK